MQSEAERNYLHPDVEHPPVHAELAEHGEGGSAHLPPPSIWPLVTALGVATAGFGLVTQWPVSILGLLMMVMGIVNWIQELRHEPQHH